MSVGLDRNIGYYAKGEVFTLIGIRQVFISMTVYLSSPNNRQFPEIKKPRSDRPLFRFSGLPRYPMPEGVAGTAKSVILFRRRAGSGVSKRVHSNPSSQKASWERRRAKK